MADEIGLITIELTVDQYIALERAVAHALKVGCGPLHRQHLGELRSAMAVRVAALPADFLREARKKTTKDGYPKDRELQRKLRRAEIERLLNAELADDRA